MKNKTNKKLFVKSYGCQMNVYDSQRMVEILATEGYSQTDTADNADMILLNTCHIREKASEKIYSELGRYKPLKEANPNIKISVAGCVAQAEAEEIIRRQPMVDIVVGPQTYHRFPQLLKEANTGAKVVDTEFPLEDKFDHLPFEAKMRRAPSAFLTVQEGCDKFCAFCVVPFTRGNEQSRPAQKILDEAKKLVDRGVVEINLLGQNVNAYHGQGADGVWSLARLIMELEKIPALKRIRYTTSHPNDMQDDLIAAHSEVEKLMPYLHLPVQSGSDTVLKGMNRKHTAKEYLHIIDRIRTVRPDIALSGDFIVGFPGETDADFAATLDICRQVRYAQSYSFKYSARPGTTAAQRQEVDEDIKNDRLAQLQILLNEQQSDDQKNMVGKTVKVLLEKPGRKPGQLMGKSEYLHAVHVKADKKQIGTIVQAKITKSMHYSLAGELLIPSA